jgi:hypothetical protein
MPALTGTQDVNQWLKLLKQLHIKNTNTYTRAVQYAHGVTAVDYAYAGGVFSPTQNRIYLFHMFRPIKLTGIICSLLAIILVLIHICLDQLS